MSGRGITSNKITKVEEFKDSSLNSSSLLKGDIVNHPSTIKIVTPDIVSQITKSGTKSVSASSVDSVSDIKFNYLYEFITELENEGCVITAIYECDQHDGGCDFKEFQILVKKDEDYLVFSANNRWLETEDQIEVNKEFSYSLMSCSTEEKLKFAFEHFISPNKFNQKYRNWKYTYSECTLTARKRFAFIKAYKKKIVTFSPKVAIVSTLASQDQELYTLNDCKRHLVRLGHRIIYSKSKTKGRGNDAYAMIQIVTKKDVDFFCFVKVRSNILDDPHVEEYNLDQGLKLSSCTTLVQLDGFEIAIDLDLELKASFQNKWEQITNPVPTEISDFTTHIEAVGHQIIATSCEVVRDDDRTWDSIQIVTLKDGAYFHFASDNEGWYDLDPLPFPLNPPTVLSEYTESFRLENSFEWAIEKDTDFKKVYQRKLRQLKSYEALPSTQRKHALNTLTFADKVKKLVDFNNDVMFIKSAHKQGPEYSMSLSHYEYTVHVVSKSGTDYESVSFFKDEYNFGRAKPGAFEETSRILLSSVTSLEQLELYFGYTRPDRYASYIGNSDVKILSCSKVKDMDQFKNVYDQKVASLSNLDESVGEPR